VGLVAIFFSGGCIMSLKKVAAKMHLEAKERGVSRRVLNRGLILSLWYREADIVLGLRRRNVKPSETEVDICATTFFFSKPIESRAEKGKTVWVGISKKAIYGKACLE
jgi:hypothetical protein